MSGNGARKEIDYELTRASAFSYQCNACKRCCHDKKIRVAPYEILRLARRRGLSTTEFIARHTESGGTVLGTRDDDDYACVFLGERGCEVHPDRPLVCRLYPLGRSIDGEGAERFGHLTPHPETAGIYGVNGTVADFLDGQGVAPFFAMGERYGALYARMVDVLENLDPAELDHRAERRSEIDDLEAGTAATSWVDIDATVAAYCAAKRRPVPDSIDDLVALHLEAIGQWLDEIAAEA